MNPPPVTTSPAESAAVFLELTRLLNDLERQNPALSAPLRLTLLRARRHDGTMWLDAARFRAVVLELAA
jgi:hypothetical protein